MERIWINKNKSSIFESSSVLIGSNMSIPSLAIRNQFNRGTRRIAVGAHCLSRGVGDILLGSLRAFIYPIAVLYRIISFSFLWLISKIWKLAKSGITITLSAFAWLVEIIARPILFCVLVVYFILSIPIAIIWLLIGGPLILRIIGLITRTFVLLAAWSIGAILMLVALSVCSLLLVLGVTISIAATGVTLWTLVLFAGRLLYWLASYLLLELKNNFEALNSLPLGLQLILFGAAAAFLVWAYDKLRASPYSEPKIEFNRFRSATIYWREKFTHSQKSAAKLSNYVLGKPKANAQTKDHKSKTLNANIAVISTNSKLALAEISVKSKSNFSLSFISLSAISLAFVSFSDLSKSIENIGLNIDLSQTKTEEPNAEKTSEILPDKAGDIKEKKDTSEVNEADESVTVEPNVPQSDYLLQPVVRSDMRWRKESALVFEVQGEPIRTLSSMRINHGLLCTANLVVVVGLASHDGHQALNDELAYNRAQTGARLISSEIEKCGGLVAPGVLIVTFPGILSGQHPDTERGLLGFALKQPTRHDDFPNLLDKIEIKVMDALALKSTSKRSQHNHLLSCKQGPRRIFILNLPLSYDIEECENARPKSWQLSSVY